MSDPVGSIPSSVISNEQAWHRALSRVLSTERILLGSAVRKAYECDAYTIETSVPTLVTLPETTEEVQAIVQFCNENSIPFVARGAGTGLSGGALPALGGVVISTKKLTRILNIDPENRTARVQTGLVNANLSKATKPFGLQFAPDPSSQSVSTIGGNISENAGGPHTLKYGVTGDHILALTVIDPYGKKVELGSEVFGMPGPDLVGLFCGSEGTMGIATEALVNLGPIPRIVQTCLIAFTEISQATRTVSSIVAAGVIPAALEMMDEGILGALHLAFGLKYPEGTKALLLVECDGEDAAVVTKEMETVFDVANHGMASNIQIASNEIERAELWKARKKGVGAMGRLAPTVVTHDGVIPRSKLPEMLTMVYEISAKYEVPVANIFHAGDGNLHPCFYFDERVPGAVERVEAAGMEIMKRCIELGGSLTGEHGIGIEKVAMMEEMFGTEGLRLQLAARKVFNRGALCNPCKVLPNQKGCTEHRRQRGVAW